MREEPAVTMKALRDWLAPTVAPAILRIKL